MATPFPSDLLPPPVNGRHPDVHVRHPESDAELRAIVRVNYRAWLEAYDDILPEPVLEAIAEPPTDEELDARVGSLRADRDRLLVAVAEAAGVESDPETTATDPETTAVRGYAAVRWLPDETKDFVGADEAGLKEIYVDPAHWSAGVGTALLEAAVGLVPDDATALVLETLAGNDVGRRFYEARGFERRGTSTFEVAGEPYETVIYALVL